MIKSAQIICKKYLGVKGEKGAEKDKEVCTLNGYIIGD